LIVIFLAILLGGVAGGGMVLAGARVRARRIVDAPHVRLVVVHEGADQGDVTVDGLQLREYRDRAGQRWIVLRDASMLLPDEGVEQLAGETHILAARVVLRQRITDVRVGPIEVRA